jgi:hypothetical protein
VRETAIKSALLRLSAERVIAGRYLPLEEEHGVHRDIEFDAKHLTFSSRDGMQQQRRAGRAQVDALPQAI